jgi:hypothetical protein
MLRRPVAFLDQDAARPAPAQFPGEAQTHRTAAHDQDRGLVDGLLHHM